MLENLIKNIVNDVSVDLTQAFDRNFEKKAFFDRKWKSSKYPNSRGSLLLRTGKLRRSVKINRKGAGIAWNSNLPYASLHNEGGEIVVTAKMKRFFWAMYYKNNNAVTFNIRKKKPSNNIRNRKLQGEAGKWKALALLKIGTKLKIEQRQFIGWHPEVDRRVKKIVDINLIEFNKKLQDKLKK